MSPLPWPLHRAHQSSAFSNTAAATDAARPWQLTDLEPQPAESIGQKDIIFCNDDFCMTRPGEVHVVQLCVGDKTRPGNVDPAYAPSSGDGLHTQQQCVVQLLLLRF